MKILKRLFSILIMFVLVFSSFSANLLSVGAEEGNIVVEEENKEDKKEETEEENKDDDAEILKKEKTLNIENLKVYASSLEGVDKNKLTEVLNVEVEKINRATSIEEVKVAYNSAKKSLDAVLKNPVDPPIVEDKLPPKEDEEAKPKPSQDDLNASDKKEPEVKLSNNNYLKSLSLSQGRINFNKNTNNYEVVVNNSVDKITISATAESSKATVSGGGLKTLDVYENNFKVRVVAENGQVQTYRLIIIRKDLDNREVAPSSNTNLKSLKIKGCEFDFNSSDLIYACMVDHFTSQVEVSAIAESKKAKIKVFNINPLHLGFNDVKIQVEAENKDVKEYVVKVLRMSNPEIIHMDSLEEALDNLEALEVTVITNNNETISKKLLEKIKRSKKTVYINKYNDKEEVLYSWKIVGANITLIQEIKTKIDFIEDKNSLIFKHTNLAQGLGLAFLNNSNLPLNTKVGINIKDKLRKSENLKLYYYDEKSDQIVLEAKNLKVEGDLVWLKLSDSSQYFITDKDLLKKEPSQIMHLTIPILILIILLIIENTTYIKGSPKCEDRTTSKSSEKVEEFSKVVWGKKKVRKTSQGLKRI